MIWLIAESRATIQRVDPGAPAPLPKQAILGDFRIPQRGIFAITTAILQGSGTEEQTLAVEPQHRLI
jgi:hypothetical protein